MGNKVEKRLKKEAEEKFEALLPMKLVLFGKRESGKTAIINRFGFNKFSNSYEPTRQSNLVSKIYKIENYKYPFSVDLWDIPGDETEIVGTKVIFNHLKVAVLVVESDAEEPLADVQEYLNYLKSDIHENIPWAVFYTKCDRIGLEQKIDIVDKTKLHFSEEKFLVGKCILTTFGWFTSLSFCCFGS
mmetsp:Transcript_40882/g.47005  ORF Transcript_40882/g.47005 Transcript_40882/m.47005 type:complete len:187 (+) Transcript_40882:424-984(+)